MRALLFCPFCRREPTIEDHYIGPLHYVLYSVSCCGVSVDCPTSAGTQRRWNEIARAISARRRQQKANRK